MKDTRVLKLNSYEHRVMVAVLNAYRNEMLSENKPTEDVDDLLIKAIDAPYRSARRRALTQ